MPRLRLAIPALLVLSMALALAGCAPSRDAGKTKLVVWGPQFADEAKGLDAAVAEFERRRPDIEVKVLSMGAGGMDPQKLMCAIAGNVPPDVIRQDRFFIGDWASRDAFMTLDDLIARDKSLPDGIRADEYYPACWNEAMYKGKMYAIPCNTDDRALFYNRKLFRQAGLDPDRPPRTWDELLAYSKKLTHAGRNGSYEQIGFIPMWGNSFLHIYCFANDGKFMSPDGRKCTLNDPRTVEALGFMVKVYDELGGVDRINAFASGFKSNELDPFLNDTVAMKIDGNWVLSSIARYSPDLDFAVAPAPVPTARYEGKPPFKGESRWITWSGGFSYAIPRGAKHVDESWAFIKWMLSEEAIRISNRAQAGYNRSQGRPFVPVMTANVKINERMFSEFAPANPRLRKPLRQFLDLMKVSKWRPTTFVGQRLWDEQLRAVDDAVRGKKTPQKALDDGTYVVQKALDRVLTRERRLQPINWAYVYAGLCAALTAAVAFAVIRLRKRERVGKLSRGEAVAGYLFASPWIFGFIVFTIGPIVASIILSFCDYDVLHAARWVGMSNYHELLTDDWHYVSKSIYNAGYLALFGLPLGMIVSLSIAMLLNTKVSGMTWYRTAYYLPSIVPVVANIILWMWVLNPQFGLINAAWRGSLTNWFGIPAPTWLASEQWAKPAMIVMGLWGAGGGMILWLAGLQGVPQHLYEAADIDGANWWSRFWNVTIPMLTPYLFFNLIMGTIGVLQSFEASYIMTGGGPADATLVPVLYLFQNAFSYFRMGYASALAWLLFIIILALTLFQVKLAPRWVHYEHDERR